MSNLHHSSSVNNPTDLDIAVQENNGMFSGVAMGLNAEARKIASPGIRRSRAITLAFMATAAISLTSCDDKKPDIREFASLEDCVLSYQYSKERCQEVYASRIESTPTPSQYGRTNDFPSNAPSIVSSQLSNSLDAIAPQQSASPSFFIIYTHWNYGPYGMYDLSPLSAHNSIYNYSSRADSREVQSLINRRPVFSETGSRISFTSQKPIVRSAPAGFADSSSRGYSSITTRTTLTSTPITTTASVTQPRIISTPAPAPIRATTYSSAGLGGAGGARVTSFSSSIGG